MKRRVLELLMVPVFLAESGMVVLSLALAFCSADQEAKLLALVWATTAGFFVEGLRQTVRGLWRDWDDWRAERAEREREGGS